MQKYFIFFILLFTGSFLGACGQSQLPGTATASATSIKLTLPTATPSSMPCMVLHAPATPQAFGADFSSRGHVSGPADAPVTIVAFSDYQCPACAFLAASLKQIRLTHPQDVRFVFVNTPLPDHDKDLAATQAVEAADLQGKFWEMHDLLYEKQIAWAKLTPAAFENWVAQQADSLGLDLVKFQSDFNGETVATRIKQVAQSGTGQSLVLPIFFVNGTSPYSGLADFASIDTVVRMEVLAARQFSDCPAWIVNPLSQYIATLHTAKGDVVIQLFPDKAPLAVNNFISLARSGWYDGITFYKVIPDFLVMTGDPSETGMGNAGYLFSTEISASLPFDQPGLVAMDNSGPDTNGSRFLITLAPAAQLYGQYTVFGKVLSGMEILADLTPRDSKPGMVLPPGDKLINVTIQAR